MKEIITLALPKFSLAWLMIKKPILLVPIVPVVAIVNVVVDFESMWIVLFWFSFSDLITGLYASYLVWKKSDHKDRWFFGKGEGFSSEKAKKLGVKALVYIVVPLALIKVQKLLFLKNFKYASISEAEFEWATIALILFCLIEGFSIFHENLPKCGFNLWFQIKKMVGFYKEFKKEIKDE